MVAAGFEKCVPLSKRGDVAGGRGELCLGIRANKIQAGVDDIYNLTYTTYSLSSHREDPLGVGAGGGGWGLGGYGARRPGGQELGLASCPTIAPETVPANGTLLGWRIFEFEHQHSRAVISLGLCLFCAGG